MARKKAETYQEDPDTVAVEAEVTDDGYDEPMVEPTLTPESVSVVLTEEPPAPEPKLSETTKAEQEAGRKAVEQKSKSHAAETGVSPEEAA